MWSIFTAQVLSASGINHCSEQVNHAPCNLALTSQFHCPLAGVRIEPLKLTDDIEDFVAVTQRAKHVVGKSMS